VGKHGFGRVPPMVHCRHDDLHLVRTMMGVHAAKLRQNETFHCHNHMNIIIRTYTLTSVGKKEANNTPDAV
jgi:hypothetical protein